MFDHSGQTLAASYRLVRRIGEGGVDVVAAGAVAAVVIASGGDGGAVIQPPALRTVP